jgi:hypothetical protein
VTKPAIGAWGLNWQHCNRMTFFPSHSYEQYYQAVRRCWRFGQTKPVTVDIITTEGGANALANLQRKADQADRMFEALVSPHAGRAGDPAHERSTQRRGGAGMAVLDQTIAERYAIYCGDCLEVMPTLPDESIHLSVYSPPFAGLYQYSSSEATCRTARATSSSWSTTRSWSPSSRADDAGPDDGRALHGRAAVEHRQGRHADGLPRRHHPPARAHGWGYVARYHVWKEPLTVRNRTMTKGLAHKTIVDDSSRCSVASADYLLVFRRHGENPVPIDAPARADGVRGRAQGAGGTAALPRLGGQADREPVLALDVETVRVRVLG